MMSQKFNWQDKYSTIYNWTKCRTDSDNQHEASVNNVKTEKSKKHSIEVPIKKVYVYKAGCKIDAPQSI